MVARPPPGAPEKTIIMLHYGDRRLAARGRGRWMGMKPVRISMGENVVLGRLFPSFFSFVLLSWLNVDCPQESDSESGTLQKTGVMDVPMMMMIYPNERRS